MSERTTNSRIEDSEFQYMEDEDELDAYLEELVPYIGWIIVYFNSLEDHITDFIREMILRDPFQDDRLDVFLTNMQFTAKKRALFDLYAQAIKDEGDIIPIQELIDFEKIILECVNRRNEYAHADWIGVRDEQYVKVKSKSGRTGIINRYRKIDLATIKADVEFINKTRFDLVDFHFKLIDHLHQRAS